ncbi:helix-turn-helix transcriptional regulator [Hyphomicrobium sp. 802]|uniref:helix-turn-helix domain-containing protein n=1 Tax=Hyphomicrobium sp. 802 TaxID=1112272 RepID=UPI00045E7FA9|nr:helix-turn-helix transcriptional regulator [Hyphomicrobium sp. 802]
MRLRQWLKKNGVTYERFGELIDRDHGAVARYVAGKAIPRSDTMVKIYVVTNGEVPPNSFYDLPTLTASVGVAPVATASAAVADEPTALAV